MLQNVDSAASDYFEIQAMLMFTLVSKIKQMQKPTKYGTIIAQLCQQNALGRFGKPARRIFPQQIPRIGSVIYISTV